MRYVLTLLGGLLIGAALVYFLLVGVPSAKRLPGSPVQPPDPNGHPPGTIIVTVDEKFLDALLGKLFRDLGPPSFPLQLTSLDGNQPYGPEVFRHAALQGGCQDKVTLMPESKEAKTGVRFTGGKPNATLAFDGAYSIFGQCINFKGWAQASMQFSFDGAQQTVYGQINVEGINLEGVSPLVTGLITPVVQRALNEHVNPLEVIRPSQLPLAIPVKASNGTLKAQVKDVRVEVKDGSLSLHIHYDV